MLNQTAIYALRAMGYLASHGDDGPVRSQTIAREMEIPRNFLSKIMHRLVQDGLVKSVRGVNGGFELAGDASKITMRDVVSPFMRLDDYRKCFLGFRECDSSCGVHGRWTPIADRIEKMLDVTTIDKIF